MRILNLKTTRLLLPKLRRTPVIAPSKPVMIDPTPMIVAGPDDHAQHGQKRAHLVLANRVERQ